MRLILTIADDRFIAEQDGETVFDFNTFTGVKTISDLHGLELRWSQTGDMLDFGTVGGDFSLTHVGWHSCLPSGVSTQIGPTAQPLEEALTLAEQIVEALERAGYEPHPDGHWDAITSSSLQEIYDHFERGMADPEPLASTYLLFAYLDGPLRVQVTISPVTRGRSVAREDASTYPVRATLGLIDRRSWREPPYYMPPLDQDPTTLSCTGRLDGTIIGDRG